MTKYALGLMALAFVAGGGMTAIVISRGDAEDHKAVIIEATETTSDTNVQIVEPPLSPVVAAEHEAQPKEDEEKDQKKSEGENEEKLDGNYGDLNTCDELLHAQTYEKDDESMFMIPGKESWVFRTQQDLQMAFDVSDESLKLYQKFAAVLKSRGTELLMVYIPPRGMIATEFLPRGNEITDDYDAESARANYTALIGKMNAAGVHFVGMPNPASGALYFNHADQHWTTQGARDTAVKIAETVRGMPTMAALPKHGFKTTIGKERVYDGRFGEFIRKVCGFRPQPEKDNKVKTERVVEGSAEEALFKEESAPQVVLVGTSNSFREEFNSNFDGYLKESLSTDVFNAAISGGGMDDAILSYLYSDIFQKAPPKLLIWELPGYYNLGGEKMAQALRQGIAGAAGVCDKPLAKSTAMPAVGKKVELLENLEVLNIPVGQAYVVITSEQDVAKDFSISIKTSDKKKQKFEFTKRREGNGNKFFYFPEGEGALLSSVWLNVNKRIEGLKVEARVCSLVAGVVAP